MGQPTTQTVFDSWRKSWGLPTLDMRLIGREEVSQIYFHNYWKPARCQQMVKPLAVVHFDTVVNFGVWCHHVFAVSDFSEPGGWDMGDNHPGEI